MRRLAAPAALVLVGALLAVLVTVPERLLPGLGTFARPLLIGLAWLGFVGILCVNTLATGVVNLEVFPGSAAGSFGMAFGGALFLALVFLADRLIVGPRASFAGTLFLPAAMTGVELFSSVGNPFWMVMRPMFDTIP